jgi:hypothetical protein
MVGCRSRSSPITRRARTSSSHGCRAVTRAAPGRSQIRLGRRSQDGGQFRSIVVTVPDAPHIVAPMVPGTVSLSIDTRTVMEGLEGTVAIPFPIGSIWSHQDFLRPDGLDDGRHDGGWIGLTIRCRSVLVDGRSAFDRADLRRSPTSSPLGFVQGGRPGRSRDRHPNG